jgi:HKD family nuclease
MNFITNENNYTHLNTFKELISKSEKILIAVAFLTESGLNLIQYDLETALKRGIDVKIFCGLNFYHTDPDALRKIFKLFEKYQNGKLYLYDSDNKIFHPKLYCFVSQESVYILIGSANFTSGGFQGNIEASLLVGATKDSDTYSKLFSFLKTIEDSVIEANELSISQYKRKYDIYSKGINKADKEAKKEIKKIIRLNVSDIKKYLIEYNKDKNQQNDLKTKFSNYEKAKEILNKICGKVDSPDEFLNYFEELVGKKGQGPLWHSGGLHRHKKSIALKYKIVIKMVREIRSNIKKPPKEVFKIGLKYLKKVKWLGVNILTEVMNTYNSQRFAVLNNNPLTSLKFFGYSEFPEQGKFNPDKYEDYNLLIAELMKMCKFQTMSQADHFLSYIYWKYAKQRAIS